MCGNAVNVVKLSIRNVLKNKVMKANAPEKIYRTTTYLDNDKGKTLWKTKPVAGAENIEYTRTDVVIEWIKNKVDKYIVDTPMCCYFDHKRAIEDFKNYMKGE